MNPSRTSVLATAITVIVACSSADTTGATQSDPTALPVTIRTELVRQWACEAPPEAAAAFEMRVRIAMTISSTATEPVFLDDWVAHAVAARAAATLTAGAPDYDFAKSSGALYTKLEIPPQSTIQREEVLTVPVSLDSAQTSLPGSGVLFVQPVASTLLMRGRGTRSVELKGSPHRVDVPAKPVFDAECKVPGA